MKTKLSLLCEFATVTFTAVFVFAFSIFCSAQTKQNIIIKIKFDAKNQNTFMSDLGLKPAITLPKLNKKSINALQANSKAEELLNELQTYYILEVDAQDFYSTVSNFRKNPNVQNVFKTSKLKIENNKIKNDLQIEQYQIEQDKVITNDTHFDKQWYLNAVYAQNAWKIATGKGIVVAVLDTGIDYDIEEFKEQLWINSAEDLNKNGKFDNWSHKEERNGVWGDLDGIDDDENGYIDDVIGYNFVDKPIIVLGNSRNPNSNPYDEHGHGTEVASVISAKNNNNFGITGIAYDAKIMAIRTHDVTGNSECKDIANAIVYAVLNGANIINLSSGEYDDSPLMHTAIKFAFAMNCVIVASAGNDGNTTPHYPSDYDEVISVGGYDKELERFFNFGDRLDITAPAFDIYVAGPNNQFRFRNGTSFAAPIVSAIAALLLEKDKTLSPTDIKGILQTTVTPVAEGWTSKYGAGIVNAEKALQNVAKMKVEISEPKHNDVINLSKTDTLKVFGSTATPLFKSYLLRIRKGIERFKPEYNATWDTVVATVEKSVLDAELGSFHIGKYLNTLNDSVQIYTLSLLINLTNGNTFENRIHLTLCSDSNAIKISKFEIYQPFYYEKRVPLFNIQTNLPTLVNIYYREKDSENQYNTVISNEYITDNHTIVISEIPIDKDIEGYVTAYIPTNPNIPTVRQNFTFKRKSDYFDFYSFYKKNYSFPASYLHSKPIILDNVTNNELIFANFLTQNLGIEPLKIFELKKDSNNNFNFVAIDSSQNTQYAEYAAGFGDSNGDGKIEILTSFYGMNNLYQRSSENSSIFSNRIFSTENYRKMYAQGMCDFDNDGKEELLFLDSNLFFIYSFKENSYKSMIEADISNLMEGIDTNRYSKMGTYLATGDFDGDGKNEIAITTNKNDYLLILDVYDTATKTFQAKVKSWIKLENYYYKEYSSKITAGDIDGDGKDEIIYLHYGKINDKSGALGKYEMWTYYVFKFDENNQIQKIFEDDIWGVQIQSGYVTIRNSVTVGNIDGIAGDEVVICAFPNVYVLKWDNETNTLKPVWNFPASISNTAVIGDFDKNGKMEIGFTSFIETEFYEFDTEYKIGSDIAYFTGYATSSTSLHFDWKKTESNDKYELWLIETSELSNPDANFNKYSTNENFIEVNGLKPKTQYTAYVKLENVGNYFSEPVNVFTNDLTKPLSAKAISENFVTVNFSERLALNIESGSFKLIFSNGNSYFPISNVSLISDSSVALGFSKVIPNGNYKIFVASIKDYYGNPTISDTLELTVDIIKPIELYLTSLNFIAPNKILLRFSEPMENATVMNINNYKLFPYGEIEAISVLEDDLVEIILSNEMKIAGRGKDYLITASTNIEAKSGNRMTAGAGNTLGFAIAENDISNIYVYPNPIKISLHTEAFIGHLTKRATVEILTIEGKLLRTLEEYDGNGGIEWDLRDNNGNLCGIGIYIIKAIDKTTITEKEHYTKFAIVK